MTAETDAVVVIGASLGGMRTVSGLRRAGFEGAITLVGDEEHLPYDRPPLSKEVLRGEKEAEDTHFRSAEFFSEEAIDLRLGSPATALDPDTRTITLASGDEIPYGTAVIATGARPRKLPGSEALDAVHQMRTIEDAAAISSAFADAEHLVVIGAGFIGSEVASSGRARGLEVTIIEAATQPLALAVGTEIGARCAGLHSHYGADLRAGVGVAALEPDVAGGLSVKLSDGDEVSCDTAVVGIGVIPNIEWLEGSGIELDGAVVCDQYMKTSLPDVYALGDLADWYNPLVERRMRVEHWTNTVEQAAAVAKSIATGESVGYSGVPYFWSDQYGHRLQLVGTADADELVIIDDPADNPGVFALYRRGDRLAGAFGIDRAGPVMTMRGLLLKRSGFNDAREVAASIISG